jgi:hypothetical protein
MDLEDCIVGVFHRFGALVFIDQYNFQHLKRCKFVVSILLNICSKHTFKRYTLFDNDIGKYEFPFAHVLQLRVIIGGIASGTIRSIVEVW